MEENRLEGDESPETATHESEALIEFAYPYKSISPQEWVARNGSVLFGGFVLGEFSYQNKELQYWLSQVQSLISNRDIIDNLQKHYLSKEEIEEVRVCQNDLLKQMKSIGYEHGYFMECDDQNDSSDD